MINLPAGNGFSASIEGDSGDVIAFYDYEGNQISPEEFSGGTTGAIPALRTEPPSWQTALLAITALGNQALQMRQQYALNEINVDRARRGQSPVSPGAVGLPSGIRPRAPGSNTNLMLGIGALLAVVAGVMYLKK